LRERLGDVVHETPVAARLSGEGILARIGAEGTLVPYEATASLAMRLLLDHGILTVHFAAVPPGTSALLIKFVPPELLADFGGAGAFAAAVEDSLDRLAGTSDFRTLLLGS
jgi:L-seryl-tRNA(Ser) seleniumtransferase